MMRTFILALPLLVLTASVSVPAPGSADVGQCMPWSEARPIIAAEELIGSEKAAELAQADFAGEVLVNVKFCRENGDFVYLVFLLRTDSNALRRVVVDAVTGEL